MWNATLSYAQEGEGGLCILLMEKYVLSIRILVLCYIMRPCYYLQGPLACVYDVRLGTIAPFIDEEIDTKRGFMTCPKSHCGIVQNLFMNFDPLTPGLCFFCYTCIFFFPKQKPISLLYLKNSTKDSRKLLKFHRGVTMWLSGNESD